MVWTCIEVTCSLSKLNFVITWKLHGGRRNFIQLIVGMRQPIEMANGLDDDGVLTMRQVGTSLVANAFTCSFKRPISVRKNDLGE